MGEYADMAIDDMLAYDEYYLNHDGMDYDGEPIPAVFSGRRHRKRPRILTCSVCGAKPLFWLEEDGKWYLGDFDEDDEEVRHVCKMKDKFNRV
jgi:hypothetical protein